MIFLWDWIWVQVGMIESMTIFPLAEQYSGPPENRTYCLRVCIKELASEDFQGTFEQCRQQAIRIQARVNHFLTDGKWTEKEDVK